MASDQGYYDLSYPLAPGEETVQCPYDKTHKIRKERLIVHLDKCRTEYLKTMKVDGEFRVISICRFNHTHHLPTDNMADHEKNCPDAPTPLPPKPERGRKMERRARGAKPGSNKDEKPGQGEPKVTDLTACGLHPLEDWEADSKEGYQPGYDPNVKLKSDVVMYTPRGLQRAERKLWREEYRARNAERQLTGRHVDMPLASELCELRAGWGPRVNGQSRSKKKGQHQAQVKEKEAESKGVASGGSKMSEAGSAESQLRPGQVQVGGSETDSKLGADASKTESGDSESGSEMEKNPGQGQVKEREDLDLKGAAADGSKVEEAVCADSKLESEKKKKRRKKRKGGKGKGSCGGGGGAI